jgi:type VI protein secretion system component Hcp
VNKQSNFTQITVANTPNKSNPPLLSHAAVGHAPLQTVLQLLRGGSGMRKKYTIIVVKNMKSVIIECIKVTNKQQAHKHTFNTMNTIIQSIQSPPEHRLSLLDVPTGGLGLHHLGGA